MGFINTSKYEALLVCDSIKAQAKGKSKKKYPKVANSKPKQNQQSYEGASVSRNFFFEKSYVLIVERGTILNIIV